MQALITIPVMDTGLRLSQLAEMLTAQEIREELIRQIEGGKRKPVEVARHLGIAPARVREMQLRTRRVQQDEMQPLAQFLGMTAVGEAPPAVRATDYIPNLGKVAQGVWLEQTDWETGAETDFVPYDRLDGDPPPTDLFAVTPDGNSMNRVFMPGMKLICRRVPFGLTHVRSGDYVIVARTAHNLHELTCKRLHIDDEGVYWLNAESDDPRFQEPWRIGRPTDDHFTDDEVQLIGKVVRAVLDFERVRH
jgi:phage repressor protein C with HTH and peptisase S24 domain